MTWMILAISLLSQLVDSVESSVCVTLMSKNETLETLWKEKFDPFNIVVSLVDLLCDHQLPPIFFIFCSATAKTFHVQLAFLHVLRSEDN